MCFQYEKLRPTLTEKTASGSSSSGTKKEESGEKASTSKEGNAGSSYRTTNSTYGAGNQRDRSTGRDASKYGLTTATKEPDKPTPTPTGPSSVREKYTTPGKNRITPFPPNFFHNYNSKLADLL